MILAADSSTSVTFAAYDTSTGALLCNLPVGTVGGTTDYAGNMKII